MYVVESLKRLFERVTGYGQPSREEAHDLAHPRKASESHFKDDGLIPNNHLSFIHYRGAVKLDGADDPAAVFEQLFEANGWDGSWRNGIYDYVHYHPRTTKYIFHIHRQGTYTRVDTGLTHVKEAVLADSAAAIYHAECMASHLGDIDPFGYIVVKDTMGVIIAHCPARLPARLDKLLRIIEADKIVP